MPITTTRITEINSDYPGSKDFTVSHDGRWIAYISYEGYQKSSLLLHDTYTGQTSRVAKPVGNSIAAAPKFSADGNKLVYSLENDLLGNYYIYIYDVQTGKSELARTSGGIGRRDLERGDGLDYSVSANGKYLAFLARTDNLIEGDNNGYLDVAVKNLVTGELKIVSTNDAGVLGNGASFNPLISRDGNVVIFESYATNLVNSHKTINGNFNLYSKDLQTGEVRILNVDANGKVIVLNPLDSNGARLSNDGQKVIFTKVFYEKNAYKSVFYIKDLLTGELTDFNSMLAGKNMTGAPTGFSTDGKTVVFISNTPRILAGDADGKMDIFSLNLQTGQLQLLTPHGYRGPYGASAFAMSADGRTVLFVNGNESVFGVISKRPDDASIKHTLYVSHLDGFKNSDGDNALIGTEAADQLIGGKGNDSYWVNNAGDIVVEAAAGGRDLVFSLLANYTLPSEVEELVLGLSADANVTPVANANGTGNSIDNRIIGNAESNVLLGMGGNDILDGGAGSQPYSGRNDTFDGGSGVDVVVYQTESSSSIVTKVANGYSVARTKYFTGTDLLQNIERIQFTDQVMSLPGDINAAQAYRIYQAAFNRTPDSGGLGFWVKQIDNGASLTDVAKGFMQSAEFKAMYGAQPTHAEMVNKFYQNVLHRAPDAGGLAFWTDVLNSGRGTPEYVLAQFAESPENQAALTGVMDAGFSFKLFV